MKAFALTLLVLVTATAVAMALVSAFSADGRPSLTTAIRVWHDDQRGVTCWVAEGKDSDASIFCLPDSALKAAP